MEPGGIEPPCQDGRLQASTCVSDDLHSVRARPRQAGLVPRNPVHLILVAGLAPPRPARCMCPGRPRAEPARTCYLKLGSESVVVIGNYCVHDFYVAFMLHDTRPAASHARSKPYRPQLSNNPHRCIVTRHHTPPGGAHAGPNELAKANITINHTPLRAYCRLPIPYCLS